MNDRLSRIAALEFAVNRPHRDKFAYLSRDELKSFHARMNAPNVDVMAKAIVLIEARELSGRRQAAGFTEKDIAALNRKPDLPPVPLASLLTDDERLELQQRLSSSASPDARSATIIEFRTLAEARRRQI